MEMNSLKTSLLSRMTFNGVRFTFHELTCEQARDELLSYLTTESFAGSYRFNPEAMTQQVCRSHGTPDCLLSQNWNCGTVEACMTQQFNGFVVADTLGDFLGDWSGGLADAWRAHKDEPDSRERYSIAVWVCPSFYAAVEAAKAVLAEQAKEDFAREWESMQDPPEHFDGWAVAAEGKSKFYIPSESSERIGAVVAALRFADRRQELGIGALTYEQALEQRMEALNLV